MRIKSLSELGKGAWRVRQSSPCAPVNRRQTAYQGATPQEILWEIVKKNFPEAIWEMKRVIPNRRFSIDIALPQLRIAIEVDGWQYHGKYKRDFIRDREKDRALLLAGWRVVRFTAGEIRQDRCQVLSIIESIALQPTI